MRRGDLRRVVKGEFRGAVLRVREVYPNGRDGEDLIVLQRQDDTGKYEDFVSEARSVVEDLTVATTCPNMHHHHVGDCCLTCGNDERGIQAGDSSHLTPEDRERFAKKDAVFKANWEDF